MKIQIQLIDKNKNIFQIGREIDEFVLASAFQPKVIIRHELNIMVDEIIKKLDQQHSKDGGK